MFPFQIFWYKRQKKLHETDRLLFQTKNSRQTLYIHNLNPSDFGNYSCLAENNYGAARTYIALSGKQVKKGIKFNGRSGKMLEKRVHKKGGEISLPQIYGHNSHKRETRLNRGSTDLERITEHEPTF